MRLVYFALGFARLGYLILTVLGFALIIIEIIGHVRLFETFYPYLKTILKGLHNIVFLLIVLSIVPRLRTFTGTAIIILGVYASVAILWLLCIYTTYSLWGFLGVIIGLIVFGFLKFPLYFFRRIPFLGVFPTAIIALLFDGQFDQAFSVISDILLIIICVYYGSMILDS